ncbi:hypothetical protein V3C99_010885 [Haemonchus contortus]
MLLKRFGAAARRMTQAAIWKILHRKPSMYRLVKPLFKASFKLDVVIGRTALPLARNPIYRAVQLLLRNGRAFRPLSSLAIHHRRLHHDSIHLQRFNAFSIRKRDTFGVVERIRDVFSTNVRYNADLTRTTLPNNIDAYEIGQNIGYGCNAAVYALKVRDNKNPSTSSSVGNIATSENAYSIQKYPLALKLMYNFALDLCPRLGDNFLWRSMGAELVPLPESANILNGKMGRYRPLPAFHPNVVRVLTAFVDRMPILDDAKLVYPDALPSAPFYEMLINEPRTMFVVMKRYRMTLREYVKDFRRKRSYHVARVLFGQLLEGCVFLYENVVSQRDMKSDNILLEFDNPDDVPHLVISDFGCALATGSWIVKYVDDTIDLGGNTKTRAPEIILAQPGPDSVVDFRMADTWAVGTLAYEIFTRVNPFYTRLSSANYKEEDLPNLSPFITKPVRDVVHDLLRKNPAERLLPHIAANVISLSLLRLGGDFQSFFSSSGLNTVINVQTIRNALNTSLKKFAINAEKILDDVLFLISAETIASRSSTSGVISRAEQQLRATFLSRLNRDHIWEAVSYFLPKCPVQAENVFGDTCDTSLAAAIGNVALNINASTQIISCLKYLFVYVVIITP